MLENAQTIFTEGAGFVSVLEKEMLPFAVRRVYYIYDVPAGVTRGFHAHKTLEQLLIAVNGVIEVMLDDGKGCIQSYLLNSPSKSLYVGPALWRTMKWKTAGAVLMVLASEPYDPDDYIRDYDHFLTFAAGGHADGL